MHALTQAQIGYIAGLLDGEGSVSIVRITPKRGRDCKRPMHQLRVIISNTDYRMMKWLLETTGVGHIATRTMKNKNPNWRPSYWYILGAKKAYDFLMVVYDYLVIKREVADVALEFYSTVLSYKNNIYGCKGLTDEIIEHRDLLKNRINKLNQRGIAGLIAKGVNSWEPTAKCYGNHEPSSVQTEKVQRLSEETTVSLITD